MRVNTGTPRVTVSVLIAEAVCIKRPHIAAWAAVRVQLTQDLATASGCHASEIGVIENAAATSID